MPSIKSNFRTPHACLGIPPTATETEIRTAYRTLALIWHPDKFSSSTDKVREDATARFQELSAAHDACLRLLTHPHDPVNWEYDASEEDLETLAGEVPIQGVAWWVQVSESDPEELRAWAKASKKAHRNSRLRMTDGERHLLNKEYQDAYEAYETWRREEIESREAQRELLNMNERERRTHLFYLEKKREEENANSATVQDVEDDGDSFSANDLEEENKGEAPFLPDARFVHTDSKDAGHQLPAVTGTWRDDLPNKHASRLNARSEQTLSSMIKELELFQRQAKAVEDRDAANPASGRNPRSGKYKRLKAAARRATETRLQSAIDRLHELRLAQEMERKLAIAEKEAEEEGTEVDYGSITGEGASSRRLFAEAKIEAEKGAAIEQAEKKKKKKKKQPAAIEEVPESWEDDLKDSDE